MDAFLLARLLLARDKLRSIAGRVLLIPLLFFVVAGPYIGWLSMHAGHLRLEGKSPLNLAVDLRMATRSFANQAEFGVDQDLTEQGVYYQPNVNTIESHRLGLSGLAIMIKRKTKTVLENTVVAVAGWLSPALFALAILGLFSRAWGPSLALDQLHLLALLALSILATYFIYFAQLRFYLPILVFFSIWACAAKNGLKLWAQRSASLFGLGSRQQRVVAAVAWSLAIAAVILPAAVWIDSFIYFHARHAPDKGGGGEHGGNARASAHSGRFNAICLSRPCRVCLVARLRRGDSPAISEQEAGNARRRAWRHYGVAALSQKMDGRAVCPTLA